MNHSLGPTQGHTGPRSRRCRWLDAATVYALGLVLIASVYIGFAVADGRWVVIVFETNVVAIFVIVAAAAVTGSPWLACQAASRAATRCANWGPLAGAKTGRNFLTARESGQRNPSSDPLPLPQVFRTEAHLPLPRRRASRLLADEGDGALTDDGDLDVARAFGLVGRRRPVAGLMLGAGIAGLVPVDVAKVPRLLGPDRLATASAVDLAPGDVASPAVPELLVLPAVASFGSAGRAHSGCVFTSLGSRFIRTCGLLWLTLALAQSLLRSDDNGSVGEISPRTILHSPFP